jgi:hypothetical protein
MAMCCLYEPEDVTGTRGAAEQALADLDRLIFGLGVLVG